MSIFDLAYLQLQREGKGFCFKKFVRYAIKIIKWIDRHPQATKFILNRKTIKSRQLKYYYNHI